MPYSQNTLVTAATSSNLLVHAPLSPTAVPGDAWVINGRWYEIVAITGNGSTIYPVYSDPSGQVPGTLLRIISSGTLPSLRVRLDCELEKVDQKLGQELKHFLEN